MRTLYYSSDGHGGLGKLDVFMSTRIADHCWDCWTEPINLGIEINSFDNDWGYKISTDGDKAYFSKRRTRGLEEIYWFDLSVHLHPDFVATISGLAADKGGHPIIAEIKWEDLETGEEVELASTNPVDGGYFIVLPMGKLYRYFVDKEGFFRYQVMLT